VSALSGTVVRNVLGRVFGGAGSLLGPALDGVGVLRQSATDFKEETRTSPLDGPFSSAQTSRGLGRALVVLLARRCEAYDSSVRSFEGTWRHDTALLSRSAEARSRPAPSSGRLFVLEFGSWRLNGGSERRQGFICGGRLRLSGRGMLVG
jgi:hypothetical protein